nr:MAG TPA: hypothetical protein [Caudoviricetes sp.]
MKKAINNFIDYGMEPTRDNVKMLKSLHKRVVNAAITTIADGGNRLVTSRWDDPNVKEYEENNCANKDIYVKSRMDNLSWIIPHRHKSESERGYMSRLNAWAWKFVLEFCCDIAAEEYGDEEEGFYRVESFERFYPNVKMLGFLRYNITHNKIVYEESIA